jgi:hypothetical protein
LRGTAIARSHQEVCPVPPLLLACLAYLSVALPGSTLGLLWPSMRLSFDAPVGALGILLVPGIAASVLASALTGRLRRRTGSLVAAGTLLTALALAGSTRMVSLQVAASAVGGAALPAGLGLVIGAAGAPAIAPSLLVLGLAMGGLYALLPRRPARLDRGPSRRASPTGTRRSRPPR